MQYFISDLHIGHNNIIKYDHRPFDTIEQHDRCLHDSIKNVIQDGDELYILGDVAFTNARVVEMFFNDIKGKKILVAGNHDKTIIKQGVNCFDEICDYKELYLDDQHSIILSHYPIPCFKNQPRGWYHLYGHVHQNPDYTIMQECREKLIERYGVCEMYNVGCMLDYMNYVPHTLDYIIKANNGQRIDQTID